MHDIDNICESLTSILAEWSPIILCFYTGESLPEHCSSMLRQPNPATGSPFGVDFSRFLLEAIELNPAIHDGAIMLGRVDVGEPYRVTGWSYRLHPPLKEQLDIPNKGSAFNSCFAMAKVDGVDGMYLISRADGVLRFN